MAYGVVLIGADGVWSQTRRMVTPHALIIRRIALALRPLPLSNGSERYQPPHCDHCGWPKGAICAYRNRKMCSSFKCGRHSFRIGWQRRGWTGERDMGRTGPGLFRLAQPVQRLLSRTGYLQKWLYALVDVRTMNWTRAGWHFCGDAAMLGAFMAQGAE